LPCQLGSILKIIMKIDQAVQKSYHYSKFNMVVGSHLGFVNLHHI